MFEYSLSLGIPIVSSPQSNTMSTSRSSTYQTGLSPHKDKTLGSVRTSMGSSRRATLSTRPASPPVKKLLHITNLVEADYFGEMALLKGEKEEPLSIISEGQIEVFHLPRLEFNRYILDCLKISFLFLNMITRCGENS
jgi:hypothetical protein